MAQNLAVVFLISLKKKVMTRPRKGRRKEHLESSLKREVSVMKRIRHPNIVTLWEAISDPRSRKVSSHAKKSPVSSQSKSVVNRNRYYMTP